MTTASPARQSDALLWADGYGSWHAEADSREFAMGAIMLALRERGIEVTPGYLATFVQPCTHAAPGRPVWCENEDHHA